MNIVFLILAGLSMIAVVVVMATGMVSMTKGGEFNEKYGNRLMQARVYLQGLALAMLALAYFTS
ncbi:MAG: twin transmembrane helix small protein [Micavibrio sp.]|nr:twin transmembrane helix small protein [Micavibrio sp.]